MLSQDFHNLSVAIIPICKGYGIGEPRLIKYDIPEILQEHENIIKRTLRYSNEISSKREETKPWESKLGGCPYLKDIKEYPMDEAGQPMLFLAQINLAMIFFYYNWI